MHRLTSHYLTLRQARAYFGECLDLAPSRAPVYIRMCVIDCESQDFGGAVARASKAIDLTPHNSDSYLQRGQVWCVLCMMHD